MNAVHSLLQNPGCSYKCLHHRSLRSNHLRMTLTAENSTSKDAEMQMKTKMRAHFASLRLDPIGKRQVQVSAAILEKVCSAQSCLRPRNPILEHTQNHANLPTQDLSTVCRGTTLLRLSREIQCSPVEGQVRGWHLPFSRTSCPVTGSCRKGANSWKVINDYQMKIGLTHTKCHSLKLLGKHINV